MEEQLLDRIRLPEVLEKLVLDEVSKNSPEFGGFASNHAVHGIVSLHAIGGTYSLNYKS